MGIDKINGIFSDVDNKEKIIIDVKGILDKQVVKNKGYSYWRL